MLTDHLKLASLQSIQFIFDIKCTAVATIVACWFFNAKNGYITMQPFLLVSITKRVILAIDKPISI